MSTHDQEVLPILEAGDGAVEQPWSPLADHEVGDLYRTLSDSDKAVVGRAI